MSSTRFSSMSGPEMRKWLQERGIPVGRFQGEAHLHTSEVYSILSGYEPLGPTRRSRIEAALERLERLERETPDRATT